MTWREPSLPLEMREGLGVMEQELGGASTPQGMHYSLAAGASDNRKRLSLAGQSPRDLHSLSPACHSKANMARPAEANMPLWLSPQVLRGLRGAVSVLPWKQKQAIRALWRNVKTWGPVIHL